MMNEESCDSIIETIHQIRHAIATKFNGDIFAINADAQKRSEASGRFIIRSQLPNTTQMQQLLLSPSQIATF